MDRQLSNPETSVFGDALAQNDRLTNRIERLSREWEGNVRRGARMLRANFRLHNPMARHPEASHLIIEALLGMVLDRIDWPLVAALVLDIPILKQPELKREEEEEDDAHVLLAIVQEALLLGQQDFGEYA